MAACRYVAITESKRVSMEPNADEVSFCLRIEEHCYDPSGELGWWQTGGGGATTWDGMVAMGFEIARLDKLLAEKDDRYVEKGVIHEPSALSGTGLLTRAIKQVAEEEAL